MKTELIWKLFTHWAVSTSQKPEGVMQAAGGKYINSLTQQNNVYH